MFFRKLNFIYLLNDYYYFRKFGFYYIYDLKKKIYELKYKYGFGIYLFSYDFKKSFFTKCFFKRICR